MIENYLNQRDYYLQHPDEFLENFYGIELTEWQKVSLKMQNITSRRNGKRWLFETKIQIMKDLEMDFNLITPDGIEQYRKGKLEKLLKFETLVFERL